MARYTLICDNEDSTSLRTTVEFEADYLPDVLENIDLFLRGAGFSFEGTLEIVEEETPKNECVGTETKTVHSFKDEFGVVNTISIVVPKEKCKVCGLTREQLGSNICFDANCPLSVSLK